MPGAGVHWSALQACPHPELRSHRKPRQCARAAIRARAPTPCAVAGAGLQDCAQRGPGLCGSRMLVSGEAWPLRASPACRAGAPQPRPLRPREEGAPPNATRPHLPEAERRAGCSPEPPCVGAPRPHPTRLGDTRVLRGRPHPLQARIAWREGSHSPHPASCGQCQDITACGPSYRNQGSLPLCGRSVSGKREPRFTSCRCSGLRFPCEDPRSSRAGGCECLGPSLWPQESTCPFPRAVAQARPAGAQAWLGTWGGPPPSTWSGLFRGLLPTGRMCLGRWPGQPRAGLHRRSAVEFWRGQMETGTGLA